MKYWTSRTASKHLYSRMNVDQTAAAAAFWLWPCHLHCPLQEGEGHCLSGVSSRVRRLPSYKSPPVVGSSCPVTRIRLTFSLFFFFFAFVHIWEDRGGGGASLLDPDVFSSSVFCGFLSVLLLKDLLCTGDLLRTQRPEDAWPVISGHTVYLCV